MVEECTEKGVGYLMIPSTGFAEASAEGARLQKRLTEIARSGRAQWGIFLYLSLEHPFKRGLTK